MCLAIPGQLLEICGDDPLERTGKISFGGIVKEANLAYVPEAKLGDYLVVHVGFALSIISAEDAELVFDFLERERELDELTEPSA
jgi:hydrogenase expression/formation protein HypC